MSGEKSVAANWSLVLPLLFQKRRSILLSLLFDAFECAARPRPSRIRRQIDVAFGVDLVVVVSRHFLHQQTDFVRMRRRT